MTSCIQHVRIRLGIGSTALLLGGMLIAAPAAQAATVGPDEVLYLKTDPALPSHCDLSNGAGNWSAFSTPEHVPVLKSADGLDITCTSNDGHFRGVVHIPAEPSFSALGDLPLGVINAASDIGDGFDNSGENMAGFMTGYPGSITVKMKSIFPHIDAATAVSPAETLLAMPVDNTPVVVKPASTPTPKPAAKKRSHHHHHRLKRRTPQTSCDAEPKKA